MWDHPITEIQLTILKSWGYEIIGPISKKMMCGDIGNGAMAEVKDIINFILNKFEIHIK
jgi:phosphopantothenoylcysteine decarboxylase